METINYKGMELKEVVLDIPTFFNTNQEAIVWNDSANKDRVIVYSYDPRSQYPVRSNNDRIWKHFAFIPEKPAPRMATWEQLAYWLVDGRGLVLDGNTNRVDTGVFFSRENMQEEVGERWQVMARGDTEWHEPTVDYMFGEEK